MARYYRPQTIDTPGVVLVRNNTIEAVGSNREVAVPNNAQVVDAQGHIVMPGLIDLHIHCALGYDAMGINSLTSYRRFPPSALLPSWRLR